MTSGRNSFHHFPENQLIIYFALLCKPTWSNATVSQFILVLISFGGTEFPKNIWGNGVPPRFNSDVTWVGVTRGGNSRCHFFAHRCHFYSFHSGVTPRGCHPAPFLRVRPRLSTILCKFSHIFFRSSATP